MSIGNRLITYFVLLSLFFLIIPFSVFPYDNGILWREEFHDLSHWEPFRFPKIKKYTRYTIESDDSHHYLRAESRASGSRSTVW